MENNDSTLDNEHNGHRPSALDALKTKSHPPAASQRPGEQVLDRMSAHFEQKWEELLAASSNPSVYGLEHKYLAKLGYVWAQEFVRGILTNIAKEIKSV